MHQQSSERDTNCGWIESHSTLRILKKWQNQMCIRWTSALLSFSLFLSSLLLFNFNFNLCVQMEFYQSKSKWMRCCDCVCDIVRMPSHQMNMKEPSKNTTMHTKTYHSALVHFPLWSRNSIECQSVFFDENICLFVCLCGVNVTKQCIHLHTHSLAHTHALSVARIHIHPHVTMS